MGEAALATREASNDEHCQYLIFRLGGEVFALKINSIKEIIEYGQLTVVPMMPNFIRGVINLRGSVVPVIDLSARFRGHTTDVTRRTCIVIIEVAGSEEESDSGMVLGVVVDAVNAVLDIAREEIEPAPAFGAKIRTDFISGMGKVDGKFVTILDIDRVMSIDELALLHMGSGDEHAQQAAVN